MKYEAIICRLDKPNLNNRYYPKEVLDKAFSEPSCKEYNENNAFPVMLQCGDLIGTASAYLEYPKIHINMELLNYEEHLGIPYENLHIAFNGIGETKFESSNNLIEVKSLHLTHFSIVTYSAFPSIIAPLS